MLFLSSPGKNVTEQLNMTAGHHAVEAVGGTEHSTHPEHRPGTLGLNEGLAPRHGPRVFLFIVYLLLYSRPTREDSCFVDCWIFGC